MGKKNLQGKVLWGFSIYLNQLKEIENTYLQINFN